TPTNCILNQGDVISLDCLGDQRTEFRWLDGFTVNGDVSLLRDPSSTGTKWRVWSHPGSCSISLESLGHIPGKKWLHGNAQDGTVRLEATSANHPDTKWSVVLTDGRYSFFSQSSVAGDKRWLDGVTISGKVVLQPAIQGYSGTQWNVVFR
ncbi:unnamed protein product, partial [Didymodactylos carnosus]